MKKLIAMALFLLLCAPGIAQDAEHEAIGPRAEQLVWEMTQYVGKFKQFSFHSKVTREKFRSGQIIEHTSKGKVYVSRPDRLRLMVEGDKGKRSLYYDGKFVSAYSRRGNVYSSAPAPSTIEAFLAMAEDELGISFPASDLLFGNAFEILTGKAVSGFYAGLHSVDDVPCHHVGFVMESGVEWQLWIEDGKMMVPRKMVIIYPDAEGQPRFSTEMSDWDTSPNLPDSLFVFDPPRNSKKIKFHKEAK